MFFKGVFGSCHPLRQIRSYLNIIKFRKVALSARVDQGPSEQHLQGEKNKRKPAAASDSCHNSHKNCLPKCIPSGSLT
jgi:hypothetical protein